MELFGVTLVGETVENLHTLARSGTHEIIAMSPLRVELARTRGLRPPLSIAAGGIGGHD
jgi:hypothetical protein